MLLENTHHFNYPYMSFRSGTRMTQIPEHEIAGALTSLQRMSDEELQGLLNDEDTFTTFVNQSELYRRWESDKEVEMTSNKSLAEYNLSFEPKLIEGKATLKELYDKVRGMMTEIATKRSMLDSSNSRSSLDTTYALLQAASAESDEKSEELSESFVNGSIDLETFSNQFIPLRVCAHLRRLKSEKMAEMIASQRQRSSSAPYPSGPQIMMPMPGMGIPR
ncbi:unnamed protein product [Allacma fusca]|uniref:VPS37 C-terminal domain-containing protein n=1 Tax=Allacma fusca TaxID=39272 RepID=A0A8J2PFQ2_9HEXA|nr:unnamed protein product [Allacma fusca]